jgi:hypothetical protein
MGRETGLKHRAGTRPAEGMSLKATQSSSLALSTAVREHTCPPPVLGSFLKVGPQGLGFRETDKTLLPGFTSTRH